MFGSRCNLGNFEGKQKALTRGVLNREDYFVVTSAKEVVTAAFCLLVGSKIAQKLSTDLKF